jgi:hypothetical protein
VGRRHRSLLSLAPHETAMDGAVGVFGPTRDLCRQLLHFCRASANALDDGPGSMAPRPTLPTRGMDGGDLLSDTQARPSVVPPSLALYRARCGEIHSRTWNPAKLTSRWSRQPPALLFAVIRGGSLVPGIVVAQALAAAAQLRVRQISGSQSQSKAPHATVLWINADIDFRM